MSELKRLENAFLKADKKAHDLNVSETERIIAKEDAQAFVKEIKRISAVSDTGKLTDDGYPNILERLTGDITESATSLGKGIGSGLADVGGNVIDAVSHIPIPEFAGSQHKNVDEFLGEHGASREQRQGQRNLFNEKNEGLLFAGGRLGGNVLASSAAPGLASIPFRVPSLIPKVKPYADKLADSIRRVGMGKDSGGVVNRVAGGGIGGAAMAASIDPDSVETGAALGVLVPGASALTRGTGRVLRSLTDPHYEGGTNNILGKLLLDRSGKDADNVMSRLEATRELVPNSKPTVASVAKNPEIAGVERTSNTLHSNISTARKEANNQARLDELANATPDRKIADDIRKEVTEAMYDQAKAMPFKLTSKIQELFNRHSMKKALEKAKVLASNAGETFNVNALTGQSAQYIKFALDDMITYNPLASSGDKTLSRSIGKIKKSFMKEVGEEVPIFNEANILYAQKSRAVNQADIMNEIIKSGTNKTSGNLTHAAFIRSFDDKTVQKVTGRKGDKIEDALEPDQLNKVGAVEQDIKNANYVETAGRPVGSSTMQNLAYDNVLNSMSVPSFIRNSPLGIVGNALGKVGNIAYGGANERISIALTELLADPKKAAHIMRNAKASPKAAMLAKLLNQLLRTTPTAAPAANQYFSIGDGTDEDEIIAAELQKAEDKRQKRKNNN